MKRKKSLSIKLKVVLTGLLLTGANCFAQTATTTDAKEIPSSFANPGLYLLTGITFILLFAIIALSRATLGLSKVISKINKKSSATILLLLVSTIAFSQTEAAPVVEKSITLPPWIFNPDAWVYGFLLFIMILSIFVLYRVNKKLLKIAAPEAFATKVSVAGELATEKEPSFLRKIYLRMVDSVPVEKERDILLDHDYDGIKELDNNLPPWWKYGFYVTIIFGICYLFIYHVSGIGKLQGEEYKDELLLAQQQKEERMKSNAENVNEDNVVALTDAEAIGKGKETFQQLCVACHRADGGGQVGPNLTDEFWLHGGGIKNIFKTITYGVPNKGMLSWQSQLSPKQIQQVASYVLTFKGTSPAGGKEPQGDKWIEENATPNDSTSKAKPATDTAIVAEDSQTK